jgi:hypothetical protein
MLLRRHCRVGVGGELYLLLHLVHIWWANGGWLDGSIRVCWREALGILNDSEATGVRG